MLDKPVDEIVMENGKVRKIAAEALVNFCPRFLW